MPTQKARINLSVPDDIHKMVLKLAKRDDVPVAAKTLELLKEALELERPRHEHCAGTDKNTTKWHSFDEVWKEYELIIADDARYIDLKSLDQTVRKLVIKNIQKNYLAPISANHSIRLKNIRTLRVGNYRILFSIKG